MLISKTSLCKKFDALSTNIKKSITVCKQYQTKMTTVNSMIFMIFTAMTQWWENGHNIPIMIFVRYHYFVCCYVFDEHLFSVEKNRVFSQLLPPMTIITNIIYFTFTF